MVSQDAPLGTRLRHIPGLGELRPSGILVVLALLALTTGLSLIFAGDLGETRLTMLYLMPVLISAAYVGVWAGFGAAIGAVAVLNFLFAEPHYSLLVANVHDLLTLLIFFIVAATTGILAGNLREQRDAARANARALEILSTASDRLHGAETRGSVLAITHDALGNLTRRAVVAVERRSGGELLLSEQSQTVGPLQEVDLHAAELALSRGRAEPAAAPGWNGSAYTFLPIRLGEDDAGNSDIAFGYLRHGPGERPDPYQDTTAEVLCQHGALALQRLHLAGRVAAERERASMEALRAALLASLSHDLRSPLAGILGSVTTLKELGPALPSDARQDLLSGIEAETRRLAAYVANLLQLTRLETGSPPSFQAVSLVEAAQAAEVRLRQIWPEARIAAQLPDLPLIRADAALLEQAIYNLLDNAIRHGGGEIRMSAGQAGAMQFVAIADQGLVRPGELLQSADIPQENAGSGLGLRICRAIAVALGGSLLIETTEQKGRRVTLSLPVTAAERGADAAAGAAQG